MKQCYSPLFVVRAVACRRGLRHCDDPKYSLMQCRRGICVVVLCKKYRLRLGEVYPGTVEPYRANAPPLQRP